METTEKENHHQTIIEEKETRNYLGRRTNTQLFVSGLGKERIILGFPWLNEHNPEIDWKSGEISWRQQRRKLIIKRSLKKKKPVTISEEEDNDAHLNRTQNPLEDSELSLLIASITGETVKCLH